MKSFPLFAAAVGASIPLLSAGIAPAAPADDLCAAVTANGTTVPNAEPKAFLAAVSAVFAGLPAMQVPAHAGAAVTLRPELAGEVLHAGISALHLPGRLPAASLVAATVKAVLAAAPTQRDVIVARAVVDAPEAREDIFAAAGVRSASPILTVASLSPLPGSQARLSDTAPTASAGVAGLATATSPTTPVEGGAVNPANTSSPRRVRPNVSQN